MKGFVMFCVFFTPKVFVHNRVRSKQLHYWRSGSLMGPPWKCVWVLFFTRSTAQGGGRSFKNRKTYRRGGLLWITDGKANPLMDWKVIGTSSYLSIHLSFYLSIQPSICLSICLSVYSCLYPSIYPSSCLSTYLSFYLPIHLSVLPSICEISSIFEVGNVKNKTILRDFLQQWKIAELTASCQCVLRFFHSICVKCCACHAQVMPGHTKCCTCHAKSSSQNWRSDTRKCNLSQEISALTS